MVAAGQAFPGRSEGQAPAGAGDSMKNEDWKLEIGGGFVFQSAAETMRVGLIENGVNLRLAGPILSGAARDIPTRRASMPLLLPALFHRPPCRRPLIVKLP